MIIADVSEKDELRKQLRRRRSSIDPRDARRCAARAARHLSAKLAKLRRAKTVSVYIAIASEFPTAALIQRMQRRGRRTYAPCVLNCVPPRMTMVPMTAQTPMIRASFGIREAFTKRTRVRPRVEVVILPLLAIDPSGNRIGSGMGFYDAWIRRQKPRPVCIGLAFNFQSIRNTIVADPWDEPIDFLCTETGIRNLRAARLNDAQCHHKQDRR